MTDDLSLLFPSERHEQLAHVPERSSAHAELSAMAYSAHGERCGREDLAEVVAGVG